MTEELREFDDSRGRCFYCHKLIFKGETWIIPFLTTMFIDVSRNIAHADCDSEARAKASQIGV